MAQCPHCHSDIKADERFCGNCGARLEPSIPPPPAAAPPANEPPRPSSKETIILPKITDLTMQPPPALPPAANATIVLQPTPPNVPTTSSPPPVAPPTSSPPVAPTMMIGSVPSVPPTASPPPVAPTMMIGSVPSVPPGGSASSEPYGNTTLPPGAAIPPVTKSGSNVWKIVGIIVGIIVVLCVVLSIGAFLVVRRAGNTLATAQAGVANGTFATVGAGIETAVAGSDGAATGPTLYSDNFDDEQSSDFTAETNQSSVYKFVDGAYEITVTKPKLLGWATIRGDYGDASISVDASINGPTASAAGLIFHFKDDKNFYIYSVDGEGRYGLDVYKNDKPITLINWTASSAIKPIGERNTLRVETSGDTIRLYANDQLLDEVSDSTITNGKAAMVVNTFAEPNVTVSFDNLVVRGLK